MNDDNNPKGSPPPESSLDPGHGAQHAPGVSGVVDQEISIVITVKGNQLEVNGPLHDTIFCYGVLMRAMDVIRTMRDQQQKKGPPGVTPGGLVIPRDGFKVPRQS